MQPGRRHLPYIGVELTIRPPISFHKIDVFVDMATFKKEGSQNEKKIYAHG